jgi:uncharacterized protein (TIGR00304 family)
MNKYSKASVLCLVLSVVFFALGIATGEVEAGVFLIFPFLKGSGIYALLGFVFIFIAVLLLMFGFGRTTTESEDLPFEENKYDVEKKTSVKGGGVVLVGPIPIVFGSNWKIAVFMMILAIILIVAVFAFI